MVSIRPRTLKPWRDARMRFSSREKNEESRKKLPSNANVNGIVGKPAGPTTAPGGSVAVAAWDGVAGVAGVEAVAAPPLEPLDGDGAGAGDRLAAAAPPGGVWSLVQRES